VHLRAVGQRPAIDLADILALGVKIRISLGRQPDPQTMWFKVGTFLKGAPLCGAKGS
jgi:hypothetical protein